MIIPKEFFDACDPSYQQIISKLEEEIAEIKAKFPVNDVQNDGNSDDGDENVDFGFDINEDEDINEDVDEDVDIDEPGSDDDDDESHGIDDMDMDFGADDKEAEKEIRELIMKYGRICMLPKAYWDYCINSISGRFPDFGINNISGRILNFGNQNELKAYDQISTEAEYHFYFDKRREELRQREGPKKRLLEFVDKMNFGFGHYTVTERDLSYPHSHIVPCFQYFESHSLTSPSNTVCKKYVQMKELYSNIKSAENDVEKWFNYLAETNDHEFVRENVEYRLFKNFLDKSLWKCYINFLNQNGLVKEMLEIVSRYLRFFMDDFEMKEQYKFELEKYGKPLNLKWQNLFDFEKGFVENGPIGNENENIEPKSDEKTEEKMNVDEKITTKKDKMAPLDRKLCKNFFNNFAVQNFDFRQTLMNYIFKNAKLSLLQKLQKCCKNFYTRKNIPLCYLLKATSGSTKFKQESLSLKYKQKRENVLKQTWIFGSIIAKTDGFDFVPSNFISSCIPHLYQCSAKHVILEKQDLTFSELKFLVGSGNVVQFKMSSGKITAENGEFLQLEQILELLPNIETLSLPSVNVNKNTPTAISTLTFFKKLSSFSILPILGEEFDPNEFLNFCIKIRDAETFSLSLGFHPHNFNDEFVNNFKQVMNRYKTQCKDDDKTEIQIFQTNA